MDSQSEMKYGPHTNAVSAMLDWITPENLLSFAVYPGEPYIVIPSFQQAITVARTRSPGKIDWTEVRDNADARLYPIGLLDKAKWSSYKDAIEDLLLVVSEKVDLALPSKYRPIIDDVVADLHVCTRCTAVNGRLDPFHALLWEAYRVGGWPCGLVGPDPDPDRDLNMASYKMSIFWQKEGRRLDS